MVDAAAAERRIDDPHIRQRLMQYYTKIQILRINGLRRLTSALTGSKDVGVVALGATNKMFWSEMHQRAMELALDIFGAESMLIDTGPASGSWPGALRDRRRDGYPVSPMMSSFFFSRSETIWGGTSQIQRNIVGERVLGLPEGAHEARSRAVNERRHQAGNVRWRMDRAHRRGTAEAAAGRRRADGAASTASAEELRRAQRVAEIDILTMGITFTVYSDGAEHRPGVAVRRHPPRDPGDGVGRRRARPRAAAAGAQPCSSTTSTTTDASSPTACSPPSCSTTRRTTARSAAASTRSSACGRTSRVRPRARRRRHDVRARGQPARAVGRQLRAREPGRRQAGVPRAVRPPEHPPRRRLHRRAEQAARRRWRPTASPTRRSPCSRRASSTRPTSSTRSSPSGWAPTLVEGGDLVVGDDDRVYMRTIDGLEPVDVDLPPHRRPVPRPRGVPSRLDARRARPDAGVEGGQRRHRQRARRRRRRRQGRLRLGARLDPLLPRRGAADRQRADVPLPVRRRAPVRARQPARARAQAGQRERRVRHPDRQPGDRRPARRRRPTAIEADPRNWVAQPILQLSTAPTLCGDARRAAPRRPAPVHPHRRDAATSRPAG